MEEKIKEKMKELALIQNQLLIYNEWYQVNNLTKSKALADMNPKELAELFDMQGEISLPNLKTAYDNKMKLLLKNNKYDADIQKKAQELLNIFTEANILLTLKINEAEKAQQETIRKLIMDKMIQHQQKLAQNIQQKLGLDKKDKVLADDILNRLNKATKKFDKMSLRELAEIFGINQKDESDLKQWDLLHKTLKSLPNNQLFKNKFNTIPSQLLPKFEEAYEIVKQKKTQYIITNYTNDDDKKVIKKVGEAISILPNGKVTVFRYDIP